MTQTEAPTRTLTPMDEAANRGVSLLDDLRPDWRTRVNFDILDMSDPALCVIGQALTDPADTREYGRYNDALWALMADAEANGYSGSHSRQDYDLSDDDFSSYWFAVVYGFDHFSENDADTQDAEQAWKEAL